MPTVRLVNSARRRRPAPRTINMRPRRRRRNAGTLTYVANGGRRRRRSNPTVSVRRRRGAPRSIGRRRRNPGSGAAMDIMGMLEKGAIVGISGALTRGVTNMVLSDAQNTGVMGYGANAGVGLVLYLGTKAVAGPNTAAWVGAGAAGAIVMRAITENFGSKILGVSLGGDPAFNFGRRRLAGAYASPYNFTIPFNSAPTDPALGYRGFAPQLAPAPPAPAAATSTMSGGLWGGLWGGG